MTTVARTFATVDALLFTSLSLDSRTSINPVLSLTGHPSVAVPSGFWSSGSPSGVMFAGRLYGDGDLLALARAFERASPRATRYPPGFEPGG
jgi:Asp-tRNA(Asn)/Glu-tRNA(Gln) amidotransferase A subunit family amidase